MLSMINIQYSVLSTQHFGPRFTIHYLPFTIYQKGHP